MFKVNNNKIRLNWWICSKLKINTAWYSSGVFIAGFDHSQHISIVFRLLAFNKYLTVGCETSHNVLKTPKAIYLFGNKSCKAYFILRFIIAPNWNKLWTNDHNMNMLWTYFSALNLLYGLRSLLSSFLPIIWSALSSLFPRDLIFLDVSNRKLI